MGEISCAKSLIPSVRPDHYADGGSLYNELPVKRLDQKKSVVPYQMPRPYQMPSKYLDLQRRIQPEIYYHRALNKKDFITWLTSLGFGNRPPRTDYYSEGGSFYNERPVKRLDQKKSVVAYKRPNHLDLQKKQQEIYYRGALNKQDFNTLLTSLGCLSHLMAAISRRRGLDHIQDTCRISIRFQGKAENIVAKGEQDIPLEVRKKLAQEREWNTRHRLILGSLSSITCLPFLFGKLPPNVSACNNMNKIWAPHATEFEHNADKSGNLVYVMGAEFLKFYSCIGAICGSRALMNHCTGFGNPTKVYLQKLQAAGYEKSSHQDVQIALLQPGA